MTLDLFSPRPPSVSTDTSIKAAAAVRSRSATQRDQILDFLRSRGAEGATDEEMQHALSMAGNTQRPRRGELVEAKRVRDSGARRPGASGKLQIVWVLA